MRAAFLLLALPGVCTPGTASETVTVEIAGFAFDPPSVTVKPGDARRLRQP